MKKPKLPAEPRKPKASATAAQWTAYEKKKAEWAKACEAKMKPYLDEQKIKEAAKAKADKITVDKATGKASGVSGSKGKRGR